MKAIASEDRSPTQDAARDDAEPTAADRPRRGALGASRAAASGLAGRLPGWAPLAVLLLFAALVRLPTIGLQNLWYDEAFTAVRVLHPSLIATLETTAHTENTPPLWYLLVWIWTRIFGVGAVSLRLISALAGIALVAVVYEIAYELAGRRAAIVAGALVAANPLFVWYSQEARAYELYTLTAALAILCFIYAERAPSGRRMAMFALSGSLALLSHYFAVFLLAPMSLWLLRKRERWRVVVPAVGAIAAVGLALIPLVLSQGGKGTQWIGRWSLLRRAEAIPQYYLTGYSGEPLGHGIELLVALPLIAGLAWGLLRGLAAAERKAALLCLGLAVCGVLTPILLALAGADYLAPRNLIGAMVPLTILLAVTIGAVSTGRIGAAIAALATLALLAICVDVNLSPRLQRGDWQAVAAAVARAAEGQAAPRGSQAERTKQPGSGPGRNGARESAGRWSGSTTPIAVVTAHLGSAPLRYYDSSLKPASSTIDDSMEVKEVDKVGYRPLLAGAATPPAPGFRLIAVRDFHGELLYRFASPRPREISLSRLRAAGITAGETDVLATWVASSMGSGR